MWKKKLKFDKIGKRGKKLIKNYKKMLKMDEIDQVYEKNRCINHRKIGENFKKIGKIWSAMWKNW